MQHAVLKINNVFLLKLKKLAKMKKLFFLISLLLLIVSCSKDDDQSVSGILVKLEQQYVNTRGNSEMVLEDGFKFVSYKKNDALTRSASYNSNDQMETYSTFDDNGELETQYLFSYDSNGKITSFNEYNKRRLYTYIPHYQNRVLQRNGNTIVIPKEVDSVRHKFDRYIYSFDSNELLTNFKHINYQNDTKIDVTFTYDSNDNVIRSQGIINLLMPQNFDISYTYDDKNNPYYNLNKKNAMNFFIILGKYEWFSYGVLNNAYNIGKNNALRTQLGTFSYEYSGDYPVKGELNDGTGVITKAKMYYE